MKSNNLFKLLLSFLFLLVSIALGLAFADSVISTAYTSLESCNKARQRNNNLYPDYKRNKCYKKDGYYYYNICSEDDTTCGVNISRSNNTNSIDSNVLSTCELTGNYVYIKGRIKNRIDGLLAKMGKRFSNNPKLVNGYIYGFYDYMLNKIGNLPKYRNKKVIKELISYLGGKFRCGFKKDIGDPEELDADSFLENIGLEELNTGNVNRGEDLKKFVIFMLDKGVKKKILIDYVNNYSLIPASDRQELLSYLNGEVNNNSNQSNSTQDNSNQSNNTQASEPGYVTICNEANLGKKNQYGQTCTVIRVTDALPCVNAKRDVVIWSRNTRWMGCYDGKLWYKYKNKGDPYNLDGWKEFPLLSPGFYPVYTWKVINNNSNQSNTYSWKVGSWSRCFNSSEGKIQLRNVWCGGKYGQRVPDQNCSGSKPAMSRRCE